MLKLQSLYCEADLFSRVSSQHQLQPLFVGTYTMYLHCCTLLNTPVLSPQPVGVQHSVERTQSANTLVTITILMFPN